MSEYLIPQGRGYPRCSAVSLCRYTRAGALERERLIRQWKFVHGPPAKLYNLAEELLAKTLESPKAEWGGRLRHAAEALRKAPASTDYWQRAHSHCAWALERFAAVLNHERMKGLAIHVGEPRPPKLHVRSVSVSVRPELILVGEDIRGSYLGAVKLFFGKSEPLDPYVGQSASVLVERFLEVARPHGISRVSPQHCWTLDVFAGAWFESPRAKKLRWRELDQCCLEIAGRWPLVARVA